MVAKAYAFHRTGDAAYEEIEGDDDLLTPGTVYEAFDAFKLGHDTDEVIFNSNEYLAKRMRAVLQAGGAVVASTDPAFLGCDLVPLHAYTVEKVSSDFKYITIRNPWGRDDDNFKDANNDGSVTIHRDQFGDDFFFVAYSLL